MQATAEVETAADKGYHSKEGDIQKGKGTCQLALFWEDRDKYNWARRLPLQCCYFLNFSPSNVIRCCRF